MGGRPPEDVLSSVMRRLCIFRYRCHLCGGDHETQQHISAQVQTLEEYREQVERIIQDQRAASQMIAGAAVEHHEVLGDLHQLDEQAERNGNFRAGIYRKYRITDEDTYTCNHCGRTFSNNQNLRAHVDDRECL